MMKKFYVYQYTNPLTGLPFYIGKGNGSRWRAHLKETKDDTDNYRKWSVIEGLRKKGLEPIIEKVASGLGEQEAYDLEEQLIIQYGRIGIDANGILTNRSISHDRIMSGPAHPNYGKPIPVPDENKRRANISKAKKGRPNGQKGLKKSETMRKRLSESKTGVRHSEETKLKIAESGSGPANSQFGSFWITDGNQNKKIRNIEDMPEGWYKGRSVNHIRGFGGSKRVR